MKNIAFFGHSRVYDKHQLNKKLFELLKVYVPQGYTNFLVGCHGDFDKLVCSTCKNYKTNLKQNVKINVVLSSLSFLTKNQYGFSKADIYKNDGYETIIYEIEQVHHKQRITFSNKKMVDSSDLIICYVDMKSYKSGAKTTINYAIRQNKKIINLFN